MENISELQLKSSINKYLTLEDITKIAQKITCSSSFELLNYSFNSYSDMQLGFFGSHWSLKITLQRQNANDPETFKLFMKCEQVNCEKHFELIHDVGIYTKESYFLETIVPQLTEGCKLDKWLPVCYLSKPNLIIMEDVSVQGYKIFSSEEPLFDQLEKLKLVLTTLAQFHSCTFTAEARLSQLSGHPVTLGEYYKNGLKETFFQPGTLLWDWCMNCKKVATNVATHFGHNASAIRDAFSRINDFIQSSPTHRNVICHGDLWINNIMLNASTSPPQCLLIDFQYIRYCPLVADIAQLIYLNTSQIFRQKYEKQLIEYYQSVLDEKVRDNNGINNIKVPSVEEIITAYEEYRLFGSLIAVIYFQSILMSPESVKENLSSSEKFEKYLKDDRSDHIISLMENDTSLKTKFEEVIIETIELINKLKK